MSIKPIRLFGDPVLRTPAEPVTDFDAELRKLVADLTDTMQDAPGLGLAAPQIGVGLRVFTYYVDDILGHLINPDLDLSADEETDDEGCLSFPGLSFPTKRSYGVVAKGFNMHGEPVTLEGSGMLARCVQHETDHLDGVLFIDRLDPDQRKLAMREIRAADWWGEQIPAVKISRGRQVRPSAVAERGRQAGIEVLQPERPSDPGFQARLRELAPDCCPVTAYGALIPGEALRIPRLGWVNLHFSVLPAWRGAAPVQHAILHGDEITGATTFRLVSELDAGPVFGVVTEPVGTNDTAGDLLGRLAVSGAELLVATMDGIESGQLEARPQPDHGISYAPKLDRADARVSWKLPAHAVDRQIRACTPAPGAWTTLHGSTLKLGPVTLTGPAGGSGGSSPRAGTPGSGVSSPDLAAGQVRVLGSQVLVGTGTTPVLLGEVQPEGKRRMPAADWVRGIRSTDLVLD